MRNGDGIEVTCRHETNSLPSRSACSKKVAKLTKREKNLFHSHGSINRMGEWIRVVRVEEESTCHLQPLTGDDGRDERRGKRRFQVDQMERIVWIFQVQWLMFLLLSWLRFPLASFLDTITFLPFLLFSSYCLPFTSKSRSDSSGEMSWFAPQKSKRFTHTKNSKRKGRKRTDFATSTSSSSS